MQARKALVWVNAAVLAAALVGASGPVAGQPCSFDCSGDTLALRAPSNLRVHVQRGVVTGNLVVWSPLADSVGTCASIRLIKPPYTPPAFDPQLGGAYTDLVDRQLKFSAEGSGMVGDRLQSNVVLTWNNMDTQAGALSGGVAGSVNVSNAGGLFQVVQGSGAAVQANSGIPPYLFPATNVRSMSAWVSPDARPSRVWVAATGSSGTLMMRADVGAGGAYTWTAKLDPKDPNAPVQSKYSPVAVAASATNPEVALLATVDNGVHRTTDGGSTWSQVVVKVLAPDAKQQMSYLGNLGGRFFTSMRGFGLFRSDDEGATWAPVSLATSAPDTLPNGETTICFDDEQVRPPVVLSMAIDPTNPNQIYAGVQTWGLYRSGDGGVTWQRANTGMVLCPDATNPRGRGADVIAMVVDRSNPCMLLASTSTRGMFRSMDCGSTWSELGGLPAAGLVISTILQDPTDPAIFTAATESMGLIRSTDGAVSWSFFGSGLTNNDVARMIFDPTMPGGLLVGTEGAGVYQPGTSVPLSRTIKPGGTDPDKLNLQLGLRIKFNEGAVTQGDSLFVVRAQTFQGYAVWRGRSADPADMLLIGLYDRTNPESCFADPCDVEFPRRIQGCFADKRATCFTFVGADSVSFFDREVYNGFTYYYAVSAIDYGYTGNVFPTALDRDMLFSPRGPDETSPQAVPFLGCGPGGTVNTNQTAFQVNFDAAATLDGVYAVPNPLRRRGGWDLGDAATIRFVNVTPGSKCEIFTLAGDLVAELANVVTDGIQRGNIEWDTRNAAGREVASGVYIYRITNTAGDELFGRVTIIR